MGPLIQGSARLSAETFGMTGLSIRSFGFTLRFWVLARLHNVSTTQVESCLLRLIPVQTGKVANPKCLNTLRPEVVRHQPLS